MRVHASQHRLQSESHAHGSYLKREATPTQATQILGAAIHVPTAKKVLSAGLAKAGMQVGQHGERIKLYDT